MSEMNEVEKKVLAWLDLQQYKNNNAKIKVGNEIFTVSTNLDDLKKGAKTFKIIIKKGDKKYLEYNSGNNNEWFLAKNMVERLKEEGVPLYLLFPYLNAPDNLDIDSFYRDLLALGKNSETVIKVVVALKAISRVGLVMYYLIYDYENDSLSRVLDAWRGKSSRSTVRKNILNILKGMIERDNYITLVKCDKKLLWESDVTRKDVLILKKSGPQLYSPDIVKEYQERFVIARFLYEIEKIYNNPFLRDKVYIDTWIKRYEPIISRKDVIERIKDAMKKAKMVIVIAPPGYGKTEIARQLALECPVIFLSREKPILSRLEWSKGIGLNAIKKKIKEKYGELKEVMVIDGLDDCYEGEELSAQLKNLRWLWDGPFVVFLRKESITSSELGLEEYIKWIELSREEQSEPIREYINKLLEMHSINIPDELVEELVSRSGGMFLYVYYFMRTFLKEVASQKSPAEVFKALLERTPSELYSFYDRSFASAKNMQDMLALFSMLWLSGGLTPKEVENVFGVIPKNLQVFLNISEKWISLYHVSVGEYALIKLYNTLCPERALKETKETEISYSTLKIVSDYLYNYLLSKLSDQKSSISIPKAVEKLQKDEYSSLFRAFLKITIHSGRLDEAITEIERWHKKFILVTPERYLSLIFRMALLHRKYEIIPKLFELYLYLYYLAPLYELFLSLLYTSAIKEDAQQFESMLVKITPQTLIDYFSRLTEAIVNIESADNSYGRIRLHGGESPIEAFQKILITSQLRSNPSLYIDRLFFEKFPPFLKEIYQIVWDSIKSLPPSDKKIRTLLFFLYFIKDESLKEKITSCIVDTVLEVSFSWEQFKQGVLPLVGRYFSAEQLRKIIQHFEDVPLHQKCVDILYYLTNIDVAHELYNNDEIIGNIIRHLMYSSFSEKKLPLRILHHLFMDERFKERVEKTLNKMPYGNKAQFLSLILITSPKLFLELYKKIERNETILLWLVWALSKYLNLYSDYIESLPTYFEKAISRIVSNIERVIEPVKDESKKQQLRNIVELLWKAVYIREADNKRSPLTMLLKRKFSEYFSYPPKFKDKFASEMDPLKILEITGLFIYNIEGKDILIKYIFERNPIGEDLLKQFANYRLGPVENVRKLIWYLFVIFELESKRNTKNSNVLKELRDQILTILKLYPSIVIDDVLRYSREVGIYNDVAQTLLTHKTFLKYIKNKHEFLYFWNFVLRAGKDRGIDNKSAEQIKNWFSSSYLFLMYPDVFSKVFSSSVLSLRSRIKKEFDYIFALYEPRVITRNNIGVRDDIWIFLSRNKEYDRIVLDWLSRQHIPRGIEGHTRARVIELVCENLLIHDESLRRKLGKLFAKKITSLLSVNLQQLTPSKIRKRDVDNAIIEDVENAIVYFEIANRLNLFSDNSRKKLAHKIEKYLKVARNYPLEKSAKVLAVILYLLRRLNRDVEEEWEKITTFREKRKAIVGQFPVFWLNHLIPGEKYYPVPGRANDEPLYFVMEYVSYSFNTSLCEEYIRIHKEEISLDPTVLIREEGRECIKKMLENGRLEHERFHASKDITVFFAKILHRFPGLINFTLLDSINDINIWAILEPENITRDNFPRMFSRAGYDFRTAVNLGPKGILEYLMNSIPADLTEILVAAVMILLGIKTGTIPGNRKESKKLRKLMEDWMAIFLYEYRQKDCLGSLVSYIIAKKEKEEKIWWGLYYLYIFGMFVLGILVFGAFNIPDILFILWMLPVIFLPLVILLLKLFRMASR